MNEPLFSLPLSHGAKDANNWALDCYEASVTFRKVEGSERRSFEVEKSDLSERVGLAESLFLPQVLVLRTEPKQKISFLIGRDEKDRFLKWAGKAIHLQFALQSRTGLMMPIGLLLMLTSLPIPGSPGDGIPALPFAFFWFSMGGILLFFGVLTKRMPHKNILLMYCVWFFMVAAELIHQMQEGSASWGWSFVLLSGMFYVVHNIQIYRKL